MPILRSITAACLGAIVFAAPASAEVVWDWTMNLSGSTETGTFTTDGTSPADGSDPAAGRYTITGFSVTASRFVDLIGSDYVVTQPTTGFLWNGSAPTQFFRANGMYTNGANFNHSTQPRLTYSFYASTSSVSGVLFNPATFSPYLTGSVSLSPVTAPVPEPASMAMLALGLVGVGAVCRRRRSA